MRTRRSRAAHRSAGPRSSLAQPFGWECPVLGMVVVGLDEDTEPAALSQGQTAAIREKIKSPAA